MGRIRNTERKKVPGNRYLPGTNRFVEYSTKMPTAESSSTASHIQDCWEISTGAMNTVTARVMPSTAMRVTMAGTESDRVRCAGACVEVMGDSAFRGAGGVPESAGGGRAGATRRPGRSGGGSLRWDQPIAAAISSPADFMAGCGSAPPTMLAWAMPSGSQIADIAGMAGIGSAASAASAKIMTCSSEEAISSRSWRFTGGRGLPSYMALATSGELATSVMNCWANPALAAFEAT